MNDEGDFSSVMHYYFNTILRIRRDLRARVQQHLIQSGYADVTLEMSQVIYSLWELGGQANQQEIANIVGKNKSSITSLVDNLVKRQMVRREMDPADRRNNIITLTDKARVFMADFYPKVYKTYDITKAGMTLADVRHLTEMLNKIMRS